VRQQHRYGTACSISAAATAGVSQVEWLTRLHGQSNAAGSKQLISAVTRDIRGNAFPGAMGSRRLERILNAAALLLQCQLTL
jgi:hypothetical protein